MGTAKKFSSGCTAALAFMALNVSLGVPLGGESGVITNLSAAKSKASAGADLGDQIQRNLIEAKEALDQTPRHIIGSPVVLLGSSLVMSPLWAVDVKRGHFGKDVNMHHRSIGLREDLSKVGIQKDVVSLATPGQFVSDAYLAVDKCLTEKAPPEILIYGIAPRDFIDNTASGLVTSVFNKLVGLGDMSKIDGLFLETFDEKVNFMLERTVFLYHKRGRYKIKTAETAERIASRLDPFLEKEESKNLTPFLMGTNRDEVWKTSLKEYSKRYKEPNEPLFAKQKKCLQALLNLCRQRNIKLYVVAMPISTANRQLLPPGLYDKYMATLQEETAKAGVPLVDMADQGGYQDDDFYDTVHLNHKGGQRFIGQVTSIIKADKDDIAYSPALLKLDEKAVKPVQIAIPAGAKGKTL